MADDLGAVDPGGDDRGANDRTPLSGQQDYGLLARRTFFSFLTEW